MEIEYITNALRATNYTNKIPRHVTKFYVAGFYFCWGREYSRGANFTAENGRHETSRREPSSARCEPTKDKRTVIVGELLLHVGAGRSGHIPPDSHPAVGREAHHRGREMLTADYAVKRSPGRHADAMDVTIALHSITSFRQRRIER